MSHASLHDHRPVSWPHPRQTHSRCSTVSMWLRPLQLQHPAHPLAKVTAQQSTLRTAADAKTRSKMRPIPEHSQGTYHYHSHAMTLHLLCIPCTYYGSYYACQMQPGPFADID
jgi:hypothetical protein